MKITQFLMVFFLVANFLCLQDGGGNPRARTAPLGNFSEEHSLRMNRYAAWTADWSTSPDGNLYTNKAPGPMLLALPIYYIWDIFLTRGLSTRQERDLLRREKHDLSSWVIALFTQVFPALLLCFFALKELKRAKVSQSGQIFFTIAFLFGNTAAILMNTAFAHALTSLFVLLSGIFYLRQYYKLLGFALGMTFLCEYGGALFIASVFLTLLLHKGFSWRIYYQIILGALAPCFAWLTYNWVYWGHPLRTALSFLNPVFLDQADKKLNFMGIFALPDPNSLKNLILGSSRGLLQTQPWTLVSVTLFFALLFSKKLDGKNRLSDSLWTLSTFCFLGLLLMNASFGGWHAGASSGPRYISYIFPVLAFATAFSWDSYSLRAKRFLSIGLLWAVFMWILIMSTTPMAPVEPLLEYLCRSIFVAPLHPNSRLRFTLLLSLWILTAIFLWKRTPQKSLEEF